MKGGRWDLNMQLIYFPAKLIFKKKKLFGYVATKPLL